MRKLILPLLLIVGCEGAGVGNFPTKSNPVAPDGTVDLRALVTVVGGGGVTWAMQAGSLGTVNSAGLYTAPNCATLIAAISPPPPDISKVGQITQTDVVVATWSGGTIPISIPIAEQVLGVSITPSSVTLAPGQTQQFEANIAYSCHTAVSP
ncbi:MAG TPA: hypothetical protein VMD08_17445 [Candidatus Baltobacteraceae bacterium]|nr:hypothetical protein [Candidatus Baltobacteraceae bacterium]